MNRVHTYDRRRDVRAGRRGSTFILVLAVLSILVLIAATLSYTARLEELSSRNYADGIQARMAALSGIGTFFSVYDGLTSGVLEPWIPPNVILEGQIPSVPPRYPGLRPTPPPLYAKAVPQSPGDVTGMSRGAAGGMIRARPTPPVITPRVFPFQGTSASMAAATAPAAPFRLLESDSLSEIRTNLIHLRVRDESAKVNINALGSWEELGGQGLDAQMFVPPAENEVDPAIRRLEVAPPLGLAKALYAVLSSPEVNYPGASPGMARELGRAILRYRYGPDGQPGRAGFDDDGDGPAGIDPITGNNIPRMGAETRHRSAADPTASGLADQTGFASLVAAAPRVPDISTDGLDNDFDGVADEPGEGIDEPDEFVADPRLKPHGDDRPFRRVEDLLLVEGMTAELYLALKPHVTVFSASERRAGPKRDAPAPVDVNTAADFEIYERLRAAFPEVSPEVCAQFAANIADYRDPDSVPMRVTLEGTAELILGLEITPYITEVWPESTTDRRDGDDGQYIEIHNPYDVPLSIESWSLRIQGSSTVRLRGVLVPGAYVIVTDDYNEAQDPTPEDREAGYGSFYDVFKAVPNHRNRLLIEDPRLEIPDKSGAIELVDAAGNLIDVFRYGGGTISGLTRSYQRSDPRVRAVRIARCTPYGALGQLRDRYGLGPAPKTYRSADIRNAPFRSAFELFGVCSTYLAGGGEGVEPVWRTPTIDQSPDNFDVRLADVFTVWTDPRRVTYGRAWLPTGDFRTSAALAAETAPTSLTECGRVNINTAAPNLLGALAGMTAQQVDYVIVRRAVASRFNEVGIPVVFTSWSELLADDAFWGSAPDLLRFEQAAQWLNSITFDSKSFRIVSENLRERVSGPRLASRARVEAVVATDGTQNQVVSWRFLE